MIKLIKFIIKAVFSLIGLGALCFVVLLISLIIKENAVVPPTLQPDAIIILGAQVRKEGLSVQLVNRLEVALKAHQDFPQALVVPCGGQGSNEPVAEGAAMKEWLMDKGVPEDLIYAETASTSTKQNIENAYALLEAKGANVKKVYVITSDYHLPRALALAKDAGFEAQGLSSKTQKNYWLKNHIRETLSWGKYYTQKYLHWPTFDI